MKQYVWKSIGVGCLDIPEVASHIAHQQIDYFLKLAQDYNEDLIRVFYYRLHDMRGPCFKFTIGNIVYELKDDLWKSLFDIIVVDGDDDDDEAGPLVMDTNTRIHFKWNIHVNEMLKSPPVDDCYDHIPTGQLKIVPWILLWLISHVLRPKNGGFSRIDFAQIDLVYIILNEFKINWAHYFVSRMFAIKECNKGTSFCYVSMITKILN